MFGKCFQQSPILITRPSKQLNNTHCMIWAGQTRRLWSHFLREGGWQVAGEPISLLSELARATPIIFIGLLVSKLN